MDWGGGRGTGLKLEESYRSRCLVTRNSNKRYIRTTRVHAPGESNFGTELTYINVTYDTIRVYRLKRIISSVNFVTALFRMFDMRGRERETAIRADEPTSSSSSSSPMIGEGLDFRRRRNPSPSFAVYVMPMMNAILQSRSFPRQFMHGHWNVCNILGAPSATRILSRALCSFRIRGCLEARPFFRPREKDDS